MLLSSATGKAGSQITLLSPLASYKTVSHVTFSYHMWLNSTDTVGALSLYARSSLGVDYLQLFAAFGNQGRQWLSADVCLPIGTYRLAFTATVGLPFMSDIALDTVVIYSNAPCQRNDPTVPPSERYSRTPVEHYYS